MKPNFFIVGAPKCGTTSLARYLSQHDEVFISTPKEPSYFARHLWRDEIRPELLPFRCELDAYLQLFSEADHNKHKAVGEGSTIYLSSRQALTEIRELQPAARIIVMLRNPVDLAYALHSECRLHLHEDEEDFETAWSLQETRRNGNRIPKGSDRVQSLLYGDMARLGEQLETVLEIFPRDQVMWIFFDDFKADTGLQYRCVLEFLELSNDGRTAFPVVNQNQNARPSAVLRILKTNRMLRRASASLKRSFGVQSWGIVKRLQNRTAETAPRPPLSPALRAEMTQYFAEDVARLARITGRDLSGWSSLSQPTLPMQ
ncbi:sulfotransferase family protein [Seohaeicola zhoushanensis]|uniref:Sulfotransferase n=1 Tax=Seohaeicola zhoushanensis TaxID=1569283 RepID=A0A8J3MA67_9RHOB|nr:sulfotransferase [Seohaeicola zhoushanensis]GHF71692.1 sulfotransferase [Seohaeicola zhoushanensis]